MGREVKMNKKGQVAIFVIIAIIIIGAIVAFFVLRGNFGASSIPAEFLPVYNLYSQCIEQETENALDLLGIQGGRINPEGYEPGSDFSPFSSNFFFCRNWSERS